MSDNPQTEYLKAKIMTATPQQLQAMLYDGAIRFCEQAKQAIAEKDIPSTHARIIRAQRIVVELSGGMNVQANPELCGKLASLYNYVYRLLVDANVRQNAEKVDEALGLLHHMRDTWHMAMAKARNDDDSDQPADAADATGADAPDAAPPAPRPAGAPMTGGMLSIEG